MNRFVVDASVALKWCLPAATETLVLEAEELLASYREHNAAFLVPDLFWLELANGLWKGVWKKTIDTPWAEKAYGKVEELEMPTIPSFEFVPKALQFAMSERRSVYDCVYVALALQDQDDLVTSDVRLANALAARFPVKWLGAF